MTRHRAAGVNVNFNVNVRVSVEVARAAAAGLLAPLLMVAGCATTRAPADPNAGAPAASSASSEAKPAAKPAPPRRGGNFYLDDGPGDNPPPNLAAIPDAEPRSEPLLRFANRPYTVFGRDYVPMTERAPYKARGTATWYGRRYHAQKTSSGEVYDMYSMTGAHPTLPIPSYVRVSNAANGRSVIIRINDRGPFIGERLIDLSYAAAFRLGYVENGSATVEVEKLIPGVNWPATAAVSPTAAVAAVAPQKVPLPVGETVVSRAQTPAALAASTPVTVPIEAEPSPRVQALPIESGTSGIFLQIGAFADRGNADAFLARVGPEMGEPGRSAHVYSGKGLFRVHIGPYANEREARATAAQLGRAIGIKPVLTVR